MTRRAPEPSQGDGSRFVTGCLFLSLVILTWTGVGNPAAAGMLGLLLCAAGCTLPEARADLRFLIPLVLYNLFSLAASLAAYRNTVDGYASTSFPCSICSWPAWRIPDFSGGSAHSGPAARRPMA